MSKKILKLKALVHFMEDSIVNNENDISEYEQYNGKIPLMPCIEITATKRRKMDGTYIDYEYYWCPKIDVENGKIINWPEGNTANVNYKVCDECGINYYEDNKLICNNDNYNYCPDFLCPDEEGYGDYIFMTIEKDGTIIKWNKDKVYDWVEKQKNTNR